MSILNKETIHLLPPTVLIPSDVKSDGDTQIVHVGIGGFHRSHQAYAIAKLLELDPVNHAKWKITGVGMMPNDKILIHHFRQQGVYTLRTVAADQSEEWRIVDAIKEMLHAEEDAETIIDKIADKTTKIISFTITEGGYMLDFENMLFNLQDARIQHDLSHKSQPVTIFGFLAKGFAFRRESEGGSLTLLSCDNILGNGDVLKFALLSFLEEYDPALKSWAESNISFPNSMVDRITPVPTEKDKELFEHKFGLRDNCLVVSEDYFQWVIEKKIGDPNFPALEKVGVQFVDDVSAYETMKLGILNAGHSLVGLLGDALGYESIHDAVNDPLIYALYEQFAVHEVMPVLEHIDNIDYGTYFNKVRSRFSNAMINDSTRRIISGSSDKFPKFLLPTLTKQLQLEHPQVQCSAIIVAAWWAYLQAQYAKNNMEDVQDQLQDVWRNLFADRSHSVDNFIGYKPVFGNLKDVPIFYRYYSEAVSAIGKGEIVEYLKSLLNNK